MTKPPPVPKPLVPPEPTVVVPPLPLGPAPLPPVPAGPVTGEPQAATAGGITNASPSRKAKREVLIFPSLAKRLPRPGQKAVHKFPP